MNTKRRTILAVIVCLVMVSTLFVTIPVSAITVQNVDLSTWTKEDYYQPGNWVVSVIIRALLKQQHKRTY